MTTHRTDPVFAAQGGGNCPPADVARTDAPENTVQAPTPPVQFDDGEVRYSEAGDVDITPHGQKIPSRSPDTINPTPATEDEAVTQAVRDAIEHGVISGLSGVADAAQREGFAAIVAEGRPTTVEVKDMLSRLDRCASASRSHRFPAWAECADSAAILIDRLGCALIAQDAELAEANHPLDVVAKAAIPLDDADLAELIQEARCTIERPESGATFAQRRAQTDDLIFRLIAAILDQVRKAQAAKPEAFDITKPRSPRQSALLAIDVLDAWYHAEGPFVRGDAGRVIGTLRQLLAERDDLELHRDAARDALSDVRDERDAANQALEALAPVVESDVMHTAYHAIRAQAFGTGTMPVGEWLTLASRLRWEVLEERDRTVRAIAEACQLKDLHSEVVASLSAAIDTRDARIRVLEGERDAFGEEVERLREAAAESPTALAARVKRLEERFDGFDEIPF